MDSDEEEGGGRVSIATGGEEGDDDGDEFSMFHDEDDDDDDDEEHLAELENRAVSCVRGTVVAVLACSALLVSYIVYGATTTTSSTTSASDFERAFEDGSALLLGHLERSLRRTTRALDGLVVDVRSYASAESKSTWPLVTFPEFDRKVAGLMGLADDVPQSVVLVPFIYPGDGGGSISSGDGTGANQQPSSSAAAGVVSDAVRAWEEYSVEHYRDWLPAAGGEDDATFSSSSSSSSFDAGTGVVATSRRGRNLMEQQQMQQQPAPSISARIFNASGPCDDDANDGPFAPLWQTFLSPTSARRPQEIAEWVNFDLFALSPAFGNGLRAVLDNGGNGDGSSGRAVLGQACNVGPYSSPSSSSSGILSTVLASSSSRKEFGNGDTVVIIDGDDDDTFDPVSPMVHPVLLPDGGNDAGNSEKRQQQRVVGALVSMISWRALLSMTSSPSSPPPTPISHNNTNHDDDDDASGGQTTLLAVVENGCNQTFTFGFERASGSAGASARFLGVGDLHDVKFSSTNRTASLVRGATELDPDYCPYKVTVYPTQSMHDAYAPAPARSAAYVVAVVLVFAFASVVFVAYDFLVERRQKVVLDRALQSTAIISSLFPEQVRDRLFRRGSISEPGYGDDGSLAMEDFPPAAAGSNNAFMVIQPAKSRLKSFLTESGDEDSGGANNNGARPIADLFPNCTVLFADISGFTAWSSLRDPAQVFTLLESVYQAFDKIARKRGVFKVETIGDSYVAVTGLPEQQDDHAVIMARFARDCRSRMSEVTHKLELALGPDTGDLRMRFGLHSGQVTAGVLRGEKSRFQLFGDTVNTAARMESTGERDKIQLSSTTAELLRQAGKAHWLVKRDKTVHAKGKGELQTYFLVYSSRRNSTGENSRCSISSVASSASWTSINKTHEGSSSVIWGIQEEIPELAVTQRSKHQRLIDYNVDLLAQLLKQVVARRKAFELAGRRCSQGGLPPNFESHTGKVEQGTVLEEVTEVIKLPSFNARAFKGNVDPESVELGPAVEEQLKRFVTIIAAMYRNNPFHNFEHASHVTMSVNKLLQRVVTPEITLKRKSMQMSEKSFKKQVASDMHNYTYGITSDPLTQFAVVFSALIHDCDHWGVSNQQLVKEGVPIADKYKNKSVAEQNSVDLAWDLLMDEDEYGDLQRSIFPTDAEFKRFRQVVVNVVMATDIFDKELVDLRQKRWDKAFAERASDAPPDPLDENRKATIVIEHLMQASDVAHTMQHWHVYQKWNRRLFDELYTAYKAGRMGADPSTFWYHGELKFFDSYIIPLAKKLKNCGVFGVSSDECLNYAEQNRNEWANKGEQIVEELVSNYQQREREEAEANNAETKNSNETALAPTRKKRSRASRRRSLITTGG